MLDPPSAEIEPDSSEFAFDVVATRKLDPRLGVFAGPALVRVERFRRSLDAIGNDSHVRTDSDHRVNGTGGHLWLTEGLTATIRYDSRFEAATVGLGFES